MRSIGEFEVEYEVESQDVRLHVFTQLMKNATAEIHPYEDSRSRPARFDPNLNPWCPCLNTCKSGGDSGLAQKDAMTTFSQWRVQCPPCPTLIFLSHELQRTWIIAPWTFSLVFQQTYYTVECSVKLAGCPSPQQVYPGFWYFMRRSPFTLLHGDIMIN